MGDIHRINILIDRKYEPCRQSIYELPSYIRYTNICDHYGVEKCRGESKYGYIWGKFDVDELCLIVGWAKTQNESIYAAR